jgi:hypothetical protein
VSDPVVLRLDVTLAVDAAPSEADLVVAVGSTVRVHLTGSFSVKEPHNGAPPVLARCPGESD